MYRSGGGLAQQERCCHGDTGREVIASGPEQEDFQVAVTSERGRGEGRRLGKAQRRQNRILGKGDGTVWAEVRRGGSHQDKASIQVWPCAWGVSSGSTPAPVSARSAQSALAEWVFCFRLSKSSPHTPGMKRKPFCTTGKDVRVPNAPCPGSLQAAHSGVSHAGRSPVSRPPLGPACSSPAPHPWSSEHTPPQRGLQLT